ncbi:MAG: class I SAM-dependent methyltransferase [Spirochaetota bacterium]
MMSNTGFRIMSFMFRIADLFSPKGKRLADFGIKEGFTVVDYGCGPGRYIPAASRFVGPGGKVYAVDIHELAIRSVKKIINKNSLVNVVPVLAKGYVSGLASNCADLIYALDMFHGIKEPEVFLKELRRIVKESGVLILEDGHQPRKATLEKLRNSGLWKIEEECEKYIKLKAAL